MIKQPGDSLGPYEIRSLLGAGGMGEVYLAEDSRLRRKVVLKVLNAKFAADSGSSVRLLREARAVAALDHANICALYEIGADAGIEYLVMQHLEGETLAQRLRRGPVPLEETLRIAIELTSALAYAHGRGVLHRDIKPQNVILLADGRAKLLDFGLAKILNTDANAETEAPVTRAGTAMGTPVYMSPEQLAGHPATMRSDIFSLALVTYELVAGRHPFSADTAAVTISGILTRDYPPLAPKLGIRFVALDGVLARALSRDPDSRQASAAELLTDFERVRRALEDPVSVATVPTAPTSRSGWALAALGVGLAAIALGLYAFGFNRTRPDNAPAASASTVGTAAAPVGLRRAVEYWFDVRRTGSQSDIVARSIGDGPFESGSKFRVTVNSPVEAFVYLLDEDARDLSLVYPLNPAGSNDARAVRAANHETDWFGFAGDAGVERLWIVWSEERVGSLDELVPSANARDLGVVREPQKAAAVRQWLAAAERQDVNEDRASDPPHVRLSFARSPLVRQLTLRHEGRSRP